ncbi:hypothetical protein ARMGADRAFT_1084530 [Armillaria gallica]|uniref:Uncharacterized protein n=1 Tax=Armillaria gallica TaxID=47427 RepID=A0A2H3DCG8_ARMGA|nr:hypothetical protein ARMGADRAFT_1084530 [Armillaria gallica]
MNDMISCEAEGTGRITADWAVPSSLERADDGQRVAEFEALVGGLDRLPSTIYTLRRRASGVDGVSLDARRDFRVNKTTDSARYMYQNFKGGMADDIPEVALDVWVEVPSRLLQRDIAYLDLHSGCLSEEQFTRVPPSIRVFGTSLLEHISRADETGGCVHTEGDVYGTDVAALKRVSDNPHMPCSQCRTNASELSSALAVYLFSWMMLLSIPSRRKSVSFFVRFSCLPVTVYASRLLGVVRKATIHTALAKSGGAFVIITAFITYYIGLSELLVTVLPIGAF